MRKHWLRWSLVVGGVLVFVVLVAVLVNRFYLVPAYVTQHSWHLTHYTVNGVAHANNVGGYLTFHPTVHRVDLGGFCNSGYGPYVIDADRLSLRNDGVTRKYCPPRNGVAPSTEDALYFPLLDQVAHYHLVGNTLTLQDAPATFTLVYTTP